MAVDRRIWAASFKNTLPHWPCPTCGKGHLAVLDEKFLNEETGPSKAAHNLEAWDPDWIEKRFVGLLECSMPACKELVAISGSSGIDYWQIGDDEYVNDTNFVVESINPAPIPISYPDTTPETIIDSIRRASSLIWLSPNAAANQIRQAVEGLMDDCGIPAITTGDRIIFLHKRIEEFSKTDPENGEVLLATKWLGNTGSHVGDLSREGVLDAFDMIEFVLENRYGTTKAELLSKVAEINKAKGPIKRL